MDPLVSGSLYDLTYVQQSGNNQWYQWKMTAVFLEHRTNDFSGDECYFSLRPLAGTTDVPSICIHDVRVVLKDAGGRDVQPWQVNLPKRLKGAVPGPSDINKRTLEFQESWK